MLLAHWLFLFAGVVALIIGIIRGGRGERDGYAYITLGLLAIFAVIFFIATG